ncbi:MAG: hypothetical protein J0L61_07770 [Planctomycetes bacterium]|nr:hypothetical protein [Planctomycetota bacterium]
MPEPHDDPIALTLDNAEELFTGPAPGRAGGTEGGEGERERTAPDWDTIGAALGEAGVTRLLRLLHARPGARTIIIRLREPGADPKEVEARMRRWCEARIAANRGQERSARLVGYKALVWCTGLLALALFASWLLQGDAVLGPAGPLRTVLGEAIIIAGWVVMWRPLELIVFDPMQPAFERRMLERVAGMVVEVEIVGA